MSAFSQVEFADNWEYVARNVERHCEAFLLSPYGKDAAFHASARESAEAILIVARSLTVPHLMAIVDLFLTDYKVSSRDTKHTLLVALRSHLTSAARSFDRAQI